MIDFPNQACFVPVQECFRRRFIAIYPLRSAARNGAPDTTA
jgi:hypothetical protein